MPLSIIATMSPLSQTLLANGILLLAAMGLLWVVSVWRRDASIADPFWGAGFVIVAWNSWLLNSPASWRVLVLTCLTTVWGIRLSVFLSVRNRRHGEDRRYAAMRARHGQRFWWVSLFTVFLLQGAILWFVSLPLQVAAVRSAPGRLGWIDALGVAVWGVGLFFEAVGDWQLARFKANPLNAGRVMDQGLWGLTRHPNYFGDFCVWWGLYLIAAAGGAGWTVASPLLISFLLLKVSGVKLLETDIADRRPDYAQYQARTNAFFPGPRRSVAKIAVAVAFVAPCVVERPVESGNSTVCHGLERDGVTIHARTDHRSKPCGSVCRLSSTNRANRWLTRLAAVVARSEWKAVSAANRGTQVDSSHNQQSARPGVCLIPGERTYW